MITTLWMIVIIYADGTGMSGPLYSTAAQCVDHKRDYVIGGGDRVLCAPVNIYDFDRKKIRGCK